MRVETNDRVIKRNRQIAQYSFFVSMGVWLSSMLVTFPGILGDRADTGAFSILEVGLTFALPFALVLALFAIHMTNLWIREPRPEQAIREGLKGVSKKSVLYHYYHSPAKHVLIAPQGVFVLIVRWQQGLIEVDGDKWRQKRSLAARIGGAFRLDNVGDPINESKRAINYLERVLEPIAPDVDVQAIVVLTDPRAELDETDSTLPIVYADEKNKRSLKNYLRNHPDKNNDFPLTPEQITAFEEATLPSTAS